MIKLAYVLDWDLILKFNQLDEEILGLFVNKYFDWYDIFKYQKYLTEDFIGLYIDNFEHEDLCDLICHEYLTESLFREYFYKFEHDKCLLEYICIDHPNKEFMKKTSDLVNWGLILFKWYYSNVLRDINSLHGSISNYFEEYKRKLDKIKFNKRIKSLKKDKKKLLRYVLTDERSKKLQFIQDQLLLTRNHLMAINHKKH